MREPPTQTHTSVTKNLSIPGCKVPFTMDAYCHQTEQLNHVPLPLSKHRLCFSKSYLQPCQKAGWAPAGWQKGSGQSHHVPSFEE